MTRPAPVCRVSVVRDGEVARLTLDRPHRHNSLVPDLVDALRSELAALASDPPRVLVLEGAGRSFSTGGDVAGFADTTRAERPAYAERLVGALHAAILDLVDLACPVICRLHGPVTGGSVGLVLACDLVAMSRSAFVAPYYATVGFTPDGGWTALMEPRIGAAATAEILMLDRRIEADEALARGLVHAVEDPDRLDHRIAAWIERLTALSPESLAATRRLLWPQARRAELARRLDDERARFVATIGSAATEETMFAFLGRTT